MAVSTVRIRPADLAFFEDNGFLVVRDVFTPAEIETMRQRADAMARGEVAMPQGEAIDGRATGVSRKRMTVEGVLNPPAPPEPEVSIDQEHYRRGEQIFIRRRRPIDESALRAVLDSDDPWPHVPKITHLADHDETFRRLAAHPNLAAALRELLAPNVKLFFDQMFVKLPYGGCNRYHQDGFFNLSRRSVTAWIPLEEANRENGYLRYIPDSAGYGRFRFHLLGAGIGAKELAQEIAVPMWPGDVVFHDHWTIHGTGPNETPRWRRAWACHYVDAKSRLIYQSDIQYETTRIGEDGRKWGYSTISKLDEVYGNQDWIQICGRSFPGCV